MKQELRVLMIDDHPMTLSGYRITLENMLAENLKYIDTARSSDEAYTKIMASNRNPFDLVLLDINLPPSKNNNILDGEDLGILLRRDLPSTKIIVLTMLNDNFRINSILKSINPNGFSIKSKLTPKTLETAVMTVLSDNCYYCEIVSNLVRKQVSNEIALDNFDRKILYHLSLGEKMKNLPNFIPLSLPTIERRKKRLKQVFEVHGSDKSLIKKAKEKGFI